ncbi:hypothetical protein BU204_11620 [Actinophytocola xanthii]|uniref:Uncharacterized protein n=1 Tax=Actinophytocola xanthii TaxID=1912961 RepID=A0A1Q8CSU7_9PSEU|nr:hypothetical protein BU204_11620 [Actinophytocola xanthii]
MVGASVVGVSVLDATPASARPSIDNCMTRSQPIGYALSQPDHNVVGIKPYYITVESILHRCGGWVAAKHIVHLDGRWLDLGTDIHLRISTKRSDGRWVGADRTITAAKNYSDETYYQMRGVGDGRSITDVHVKHFAEPGQTSVFPASKAKAGYGPWNGSEASPQN